MGGNQSKDKDSEKAVKGGAKSPAGASSSASAATATVAPPPSSQGPTLQEIADRLLLPDPEERRASVPLALHALQPETCLCLLVCACCFHV